MTSNMEWMPFLEDVFYTGKFLEPTESFHMLKSQSFHLAPISAQEAWEAEEHGL